MTCKANVLKDKPQLIFFLYFINTSTMVFSLTLHLFVVFYRVDGLYKMMRGKPGEGNENIYNEGCFWGPKVPC